MILQLTTPHDRAGFVSKQEIAQHLGHVYVRLIHELEGLLSSRARKSHWRLCAVSCDRRVPPWTPMPSRCKVRSRSCVPPSATRSAGQQNRCVSAGMSGVHAGAPASASHDCNTLRTYAGTQCLMLRWPCRVPYSGLPIVVT